MINTSYHCDYFIDFHEKFLNYIQDKSNNLIDLDFQVILKNIDYIFPKEQVNSLYVSNGINNELKDDFLNQVFDKIIETMIKRIHYFKHVYLVHFVSDSVFYNSFLEDIEKNFQTTVIKNIRFEHIHKYSFCFHYDYKMILREIFKRVYSSHKYKLERNQIINEIKRLQQFSIQSEDFSFVNELIFYLKNTETIIKLDLDKVHQTIKPILSKWFKEDKSINIFEFIISDSIEVKKQITLRKPVQYFYYLLFVLKDFNLITDNRINKLITKGIFIHWDSSKIDMETLSNARYRYKKFDFSNYDNKKSEGCIKDLRQFYLSHKQ